MVRFGDTVRYEKRASRKVRSFDFGETDRSDILSPPPPRIVKADTTDTQISCTPDDKCSFTQCAVDVDCGVKFIILSPVWDLGRPVAISDEVYFAYAADTSKTLTVRGEMVVVKNTF